MIAAILPRCFNYQRDKQRGKFEQIFFNYINDKATRSCDASVSRLRLQSSVPANLLVGQRVSKNLNKKGLCSVLC